MTASASRPSRTAKTVAPQTQPHPRRNPATSPRHARATTRTRHAHPSSPSSRNRDCCADPETTGSTEPAQSLPTPPRPPPTTGTASHTRQSRQTPARTPGIPSQRQPPNTACSRTRCRSRVILPDSPPSLSHSPHNHPRSPDTVSHSPLSLSQDTTPVIPGGRPFARLRSICWTENALGASMIDTPRAWRLRAWLSTKASLQAVDGFTRRDGSFLQRGRNRRPRRGRGLDAGALSALLY